MGSTKRWCPGTLHGMALYYVPFLIRRSDHALFSAIFTPWIRRTWFLGAHLVRTRGGRISGETSRSACRLELEGGVHIGPGHGGNPVGGRTRFGKYRYLENVYSLIPTRATYLTALARLACQPQILGPGWCPRTRSLRLAGLD